MLHAFGDHFTAGLDLPTIAPLHARGEKAIPPGLVEPTTSALPGYRRRTKPMVAAVKGIMFTVGIELMLARRHRGGGGRLPLLATGGQRGIMATGGATLRMAERAGLGNAMLHLLTGDEFGSAEALRLNFVQKVVPAGQELDEALRIAERSPRRRRWPWWPRGSTPSRRSEEGPLAAMLEFVATQQQLSNSEDAGKACSHSSKSGRRDSAAAKARSGRPAQGLGKTQFMAIGVGDVEISLAPAGVARGGIRVQAFCDRFLVQGIDIGHVEDRPAPPGPLPLAALGGEVQAGVAGTQAAERPLHRRRSATESPVPGRTAAHEPCRAWPTSRR